MKFKHKQWRKLYADEEGAFADLPWFARAAAAELLKRCDDAGRIHVGELRDDETPALGLARVIAFRMGATRGDRRLMAQLFPMLFEEQYLVWRAPYAVVRNFVAAQRRWDDEEETSPAAPPPDDTRVPAEPPPSNEATTTAPPTDHDGATTEQRSDHDGATNGERTGNDGATKQELSARNHDADDASARARGRSSVPSPVDLSRVEGDPERPDPPPPPEAAPAVTDLARSAVTVVACPSVERPNALRGDEALDALCRASGGRFAGSASASQLVELGELARTAHPRPLTLDDFEQLGRAYVAGKTLAWLKSPSLGVLLRNGGEHLFAAIDEARAARPGPRPQLAIVETRPPGQPPLDRADMLRQLHAIKSNPGNAVAALEAVRRG